MGKKINIWTDPWIPSSENGMVISPRGTTILTRVSDLLNPITGAWDEQILIENFYSADVGRILQIPVNTQSFDDYCLAIYDSWTIYCQVGLPCPVETSVRP